MISTGGPLARTNCLSMILETDIAEHQGIAWRLETAEPDPHNPLIKPAYPWDSGAFFAHGTVLRDPIDGLWKAWNISNKEDLGDFEASRRLTYAVSDDGVKWERPLLDIVKQPGYPKTKVCTRIRARRRSGTSPGSPRDARCSLPSAPRLRGRSARSRRAVHQRAR